MPSPPTKRAEVVKELFQSLTQTTRTKIAHPQMGACSNSLSDETKQLVQEFYQDDANSRVMPGKKDVLSVKGTGKKKEKMRKRLLLVGIDVLDEEYHPNNQVGQSKFFQLRPTWVIPVQKQSQEVCKCIYHENIDKLCNCLVNFARKKKFVFDFKTGSTADNIWTVTVCDKYNQECIWRRCNICGASKIHGFL